MRRLLLALVTVAGALALVFSVTAASAATADPLGQVTEFTTGMRIESYPAFIAAGPDGNMWFTDTNWVLVDKITPAGDITEYPAFGTVGGEPSGIAAGPDGNMWFTAQEGPKIAKITPSGAVTDYVDGFSPNAGPFDIAAGPDGNMWFTDPWGDGVGKITPSGVVTEYATTPPILDSSGPRGIAAGPDGNMWFTEDAGRVGKITPDGVITEYTAGISAGSLPRFIAAGPDGNMWFTEWYGGIAKVSSAGVVTEYTAGISAGSGLSGIAAGPDGNMWFTEVLGHRIGVITPGGLVTEYTSDFSTAGGVLDIAAGPDGNMWFTESWWPGTPLWPDVAPTGRIGKIGTAPAGGPVDANGDGVADVLQPSGTPAGSFVDVSLSPVTNGSIVSTDTGVSVSVVDAANPDGVEITVSGTAGGQATFSLCGSTVQFAVGGDMFVTCHSLGLRVMTGSAVVVLNPSTTLTVPAGVTAVLSNTGSGFSVVNQGGAVTVTTNGVVTLVAPGSVPVAIDTTLPLITFAAHAPSYTVDQRVAITCTATDASGIAWSTCPSVVNAPAYTFPLGPNTVSAGATDATGNTSGASTSFSVRVTPTSLCVLTHQFVQASAKYQALPVRLRAAVDKLISVACKPLDAITAKLTAKQKVALVTAFKNGAQALVQPGWLTQTQATKLRALADAL